MGAAALLVLLEVRAGAQCGDVAPTIVLGGAPGWGIGIHGAHATATSYAPAG